MLQSTSNIDSGHSWHLNIQQHHVRGLFFDKNQRGLTIVGMAYDIQRIRGGDGGKRIIETSTCSALVIYDKNFQWADLH